MASLPVMMTTLPWARGALEPAATLWMGGRPEGDGWSCWPMAWMRRPACWSAMMEVRCGDDR